MVDESIEQKIQFLKIKNEKSNINNVETNHYEFKRNNDDLNKIIKIKQRNFGIIFIL